jgi:hypothetical protein
MGYELIAIHERSNTMPFAGTNANKHTKKSPVAPGDYTEI